MNDPTWAGVAIVALGILAELLRRTNKNAKAAAEQTRPNGGSSPHDQITADLAAIRSDLAEMKQDVGETKTRIAKIEGRVGL